MWCAALGVLQMYYSPCGPYLTLLVTSSRFLYNLPHETDPHNVFLLDVHVGKWVVPFSLLTMATNVLSSGKSRPSIHSTV